jgi:hypothetical protein
MTIVDGAPENTHEARGSIRQMALAPGLEYSWSPNFGVLFAARVITNGHNVRSSVTPAIAFNAVL